MRLAGEGKKKRREEGTRKNELGREGENQHKIHNQQFNGEVKAKKRRQGETRKDELGREEENRRRKLEMFREVGEPEKKQIGVRGFWAFLKK